MKTRNYETMFITRPDLEEEEREKAIERIKGIITDNGGEIKEVDEWGSRKLAYELNDYTSGYYTLINFEADSSVLDEMNRVFKIMGEVLRHLIVRKDN